MNKYPVSIDVRKSTRNRVVGGAAALATAAALVAACAPSPSTPTIPPKNMYPGIEQQDKLQDAADALYSAFAGPTGIGQKNDTEFGATCEPGNYAVNVSVKGGIYSFNATVDPTDVGLPARASSTQSEPSQFSPKADPYCLTSETLVFTADDSSSELPTYNSGFHYQDMTNADGSVAYAWAPQPGAAFDGKFFSDAGADIALDKTLLSGVEGNEAPSASGLAAAKELIPAPSSPRTLQNMPTPSS